MSSTEWKIIFYHQREIVRLHRSREEALSEACKLKRNGFDVKRIEAVAGNATLDAVQIDKWCAEHSGLQDHTEDEK